MNRFRPPEHSEDGSILLFALIFLTAVAFMVTALIDQADGGFRAAGALHQLQGSQSAAAAVVQEAMSSLSDPDWYNHNWPQLTNPPTTAKCPQSPGNSNPVGINAVPIPIQANCTYLSVQPRQVEITACPGTTPVRDCPTPMLRAYVTLSQSGPNPVYVTINDWSALYESNG